MQHSFNIETPKKWTLAPTENPVQVRGWFVDGLGRPAKTVWVRIGRTSHPCVNQERPDVASQLRDRWPDLSVLVGFNVEVAERVGPCRLVVEAETLDGERVELGRRLLWAAFHRSRRERLPPTVPDEIVPDRRISDSPEVSTATGQERQVLVISHDAALAGAQQLVLTLLAEWKRQAPFSIKIICVNGGELRRQFEDLFPTLVLSDFKTNSSYEAALRDFTRESFWIIYSSTVVNGLLLKKLRFLGIPVVTHCHELQKSIERWAPGKIMEATLDYSDFFLAGSRTVEANLRDRHGVPVGRLDVVYDFIEPWTATQTPASSKLLALRQELAIADSDVVVYGCGTTDWRKGPDLFLQIAIQACAQEASLKFIWIGGEASYGHNELSVKGLVDRVLFIGNRPQSRRFYYTGNIFALTSREDPCPLVALEAADAGLPIICFERAGDIPHIFGNECGVVIPFEDVGAAAAAIVRLARNPDMRVNLGRCARQRVQLGHDVQTAAVAIEKVFDRLRNRAPAATGHSAMPLVSVIVPSYNHEKHLAERLRTVADQTLRDIEIILLDDASSDGSLRILSQFAAGDRRARLVRNERNSGSAFRQWRKGMREARGKYIWIAESDDMAEVSLLATLVGRLEADSAIGIACCQLRMMDAEGKIGGTPNEWLEELHPTRWKADFTNDGLEEIRHYLSRKNTILNASGVVFRNFEGIYELVPDCMRLCGDWLFWIRLCARGKIAYVAATLNYWRLNTSNARTRPLGDLEWTEGEQIINEAADLLELDANARAAIVDAFRDRCIAWTVSIGGKK